jgi:NitT/TauT family transport system ATP-binding protein
MTITFEQVSKIYQSPRAEARTVALEKVSLVLAEGELVVLLGPSGCGKTTLLKLLAGFEFPTSGRVLVDGQPVSKPGPDRGTVFQAPTLFPWLTTLNNVLFGPRVNGHSDPQMHAKALDVLKSVGLAGFEHHLPHNLSGGMQQRAAIARVLVNEPKILLADEPFAALDEYTRRAMQQLFLKVARKPGRSLLFVTHSIEEAVYLGDRIVVMSPRPGRIQDIIDVPIAHPRERSSREFLDMMGRVYDQVAHHSELEVA